MVIPWGEFTNKEGELMAFMPGQGCLRAGLPDGNGERKREWYPCMILPMKMVI